MSEKRSRQITHEGGTSQKTQYSMSIHLAFNSSKMIAKDPSADDVCVNIKYAEDSDNIVEGERRGIM